MYIVAGLKMKCGDGGGKLMSHERVIWSVEEKLGTSGVKRKKREQLPSDAT
jgi:hypothetical protein